MTGQFAVSLVFALTLTFGAYATIRHRALAWLVIGLSALTLAVDLIAEIARSHNLLLIDTALKLACLTVLVFVTLERTLRPARTSGYRVIGGIAAHLLIGLTWAFGYQLLIELAPGAIHLEHGATSIISSNQPAELMYVSSVTLTTVGYGDVQPALVGQL